MRRFLQKDRRRQGLRDNFFTPEKNGHVDERRREDIHGLAVPPCAICHCPRPHAALPRSVTCCRKGPTLGGLPWSQYWTIRRTPKRRTRERGTTWSSGDLPPTCSAGEQSGISLRCLSPVAHTLRAHVVTQEVFAADAVIVCVSKRLDRNALQQRTLCPALRHAHCVEKGPRGRRGSRTCIRSLHGRGRRSLASPARPGPHDLQSCQAGSKER